VVLENTFWIGRDEDDLSINFEIDIQALDNRTIEFIS
jgi:hypothetical protein